MQRLSEAQRAYTSGYNAYLDGAEEWQSPYGSGERGSLEWRDGWQAAQAEDRARAA